jgi:hypothetical protein
MMVITDIITSMSETRGRSECRDPGNVIRNERKKNMMHCQMFVMFVDKMNF